jgi:hypothetical protein
METHLPNFKKIAQEVRYRNSWGPGWNRPGPSLPYPIDYLRLLTAS